MSASDDKLQSLRDEINQLKAKALVNQANEEKIISELQSKIEEEVQLAMDLDQAKSETRRLRKNVVSLQESVSEHRAMIRAAEHDKEEEAFEAELNSEVERHQTLLAARENAVDALAAVSAALQLSDIDDESNNDMNVDDILNMVKLGTEGGDGTKKKSSDPTKVGDKVKGDSDDSDDEEVNLDDDKPLNSTIVADSDHIQKKQKEPLASGDTQLDRAGAVEEGEEESHNLSQMEVVGGNRGRSSTTESRDEEGRSISRDGDSFSSFMLTSAASSASHPTSGHMDSLDEHGRDAAEIEKIALELKKSAPSVAARTATARGNLARVVRLIKVYIELLPDKHDQTAKEEEKRETLLELVSKYEAEGGIDSGSTWMEYHMKRKALSGGSAGDHHEDNPLWLSRLLQWAVSYQQTVASATLRTHHRKHTEEDTADSAKSKTKKNSQESKLNRQFYVGVELNDSEAFINAQTNALITLARRSGCFTSIVGSRYMGEEHDDHPFSEDDKLERERQQKLLKQKIKDAEEDDEDDEINIGGVLICHAYEWQVWGVFNKGGRWSGLREDLPSPLCNLLPPPSLEHTVVPVSTGRNRSSSTTSGGGGGGDAAGGGKRRSSNTFFALRGLGELYTDANANTAVSFNPTNTSEQEDLPIGAVGMNWKWLDSWHVDSFTTPQSLEKGADHHHHSQHGIKTKSGSSHGTKDTKEVSEKKKKDEAAAAAAVSGGGGKYNFKSTSAADDERTSEAIKEEDDDEVALSYLTDADGWQYGVESKEGFELLCQFKGSTTCGIDEGIAGRPARQLRRRRWSRACQLSGLKTQFNPWPDLFKALVSNKKHWMNNNDGQNDVDHDDDDDDDDANNNSMIPTLPNSFIGEWSRILKLQHRLAKCSLSVNKYAHALSLAQALELEDDVEALSKKRRQRAYHDAVAEKMLLEKDLKVLERSIESAEHDARNEKRLREALAQAQEVPI
jgi:hypothetical protein